jgi:nucleoside-diphosphate-sugar epimerase
VAARALITGATGLIGTHLRRIWDAPGLDPSYLDHRQHDLLEPGVARSVVTTLRPTVVLHLAWVASGTSGYRTSPDNERWVSASMELREACRDMGARLVLTGTALDAQPTASDAYVASKVRLRALLEQDIQAGDLTWLRPYYVVDPDRGRPALVREAVAAASSGRSLHLRTPHDEHDFVHAADVARAALLTITQRLGGDVPVGAGRLRRVCDLVEALGANWTAEPGPIPGTAHHHEPAPIARLASHGWSPTDTEEMFAGE